YGYEDVEALEEAWLAAVRAEAKKNAAAAKGAEPKEGKDSAAGLAPRHVSVTSTPEGKLQLDYPREAVQPVTSYVLRESQGRHYYEPVTTHRRTAVAGRQVLAPDRVEVFDTQGRSVETKVLQKRASGGKPVAALLSADGRKVDPYYLQVVKEDTLVIVI